MRKKAENFKLNIQIQTRSVDMTKGAIGVRVGGARGAAAPPNFGQLRFLGQREKFGQTQFLKTSPCLFNYFKDLNINLKSA